ncbi:MULTISPECIES: hypothetical protein [unclassified Xanthobacter]|uniref:hypothetical protein n=1 Tax=unclassified Xanthobacter TaxID=2623496 RepID=UPI001EDF191D|nr:MULTISPECIES: hypothetical protein [unclassified Xanthobacter]
MRLGILALGVAAAIGLGAVMVDGASAAPLTPATAAAAQGGVDVAAENVGWVCNRNRCVWDPRFRGPVPPYARGWGRPRHPWCRWEQVRTPRGWRWVEVCRR